MTRMGTLTCEMWNHSRFLTFSHVSTRFSHVFSHFSAKTQDEACFVGVSL